jgi:general secretion pathway protein M
MRDWFESLQPRERIALIAASVITVIGLLYVLAWNPLDSAVDRLRDGVASQTTTLAWMQSASAEVRQLKRTQPRRSGGGNRSLLSVVDQSAQRAGLRQALQRMEPEGSDSVKLWVTATAFDTLVSWLGELQQNEGIAVSALAINPTEVEGQVEARLTLQRGVS